MHKTKELREGWKLLFRDARLDVPQMPMQVHDILWHHKQIGPEYQRGDTRRCAWVAELDWTYEIEFDAQAEEGDAFLQFDGLDTLAEIRLNDICIGRYEDFYLPLELPVEQALVAGRNRLQIIFHSVPKRLQTIESELGPQGIADAVPARYIRKNFHDFTSYLGANPEYLKVGVYAPVRLVFRAGARIAHTDIRYSLSDAFDDVEIEACCTVEGGEAKATVTILSPDGLEISQEASCGKAEFRMANPKLWWPRGYGEQPLYTVRFTLTDADGKTLDSLEKRIGFRRVTMVECLDFTINGQQIKLWGANLTPIDGRSAVVDEARLTELVRMARDSNMNALRVWGEGEPFPDALYELADEWGILLWQEFFLGHAQYPNNPTLREAVLKEAEHLILRLRHHASIVLWCGGNECVMSRDFLSPDAPYQALRLIEDDLRRLCAQLDPMRPYLSNSPTGGAYANDPDVGDTHSYTNSWFVPGGDYPRFVSENLRVTLPRPESLQKYLGDDPIAPPAPHTYGALPWPEQIEGITSAQSNIKLPPVERFYDATTPAEMVYRFGAATGEYLRESIERYRRGRPLSDAFGARRTRGHLVWKLNTTLPHIYSSLIDYYLEPCMAYYYVKRAYAQTLLSLEISDRIVCWCINDSPVPVSGILTCSLFDTQQNQTVRQLTRPIRVEPGESAPIVSLDEFGQFTRDKAIRAQLVNERGAIIAQTNAFADIERHLTFPAPGITAQWKDGELVIRCEEFARCTQLSTDAMGYRFEDNCFDLFPDEEKRVRVAGPSPTAVIKVQSAHNPACLCVTAQGIARHL